MKAGDLRDKFFNFFIEQGHKIAPSSSLVPGDPSVLFTSAGMQQFIPYLSGQKDVVADFGSRHLCSIQKCFRSDDIDEVGDDTHHTFFEMLGNWSIGQDEKTGYFKEGAIKYALQFFTEVVGLDKSKFWITIFSGDKDIPKDTESMGIWQALGIPLDRIVQFGPADNFWGPVTETGPCGPCSEIHYDRGEKYGCGEKDCGPNCPRCKRFVELWNLVFMEYDKTKDGSFVKLPQKNVDTGIGFERLISILQNKDSAYETDLFMPVIEKIEEISGKKYQENKNYFRIIADHVRGAVFLITDGIVPSNVERGYILRRILRRAMRYGKLLTLPENFLFPLVQATIGTYGDVYPEVKKCEQDILQTIKQEEEKFEKMLESGLKQLDKIISQGVVTGAKASTVYQTYGFPLELIEEIVTERGGKIEDREQFFVSFKKHQEISRAGSGKKFGGGGEFSPKLHTATHLLHAALRQVLGEHVQQMGSDITAERLRFDFSHPQKMTPQEIKQVEDLVNQKIKEDLPIEKEEMVYQEAVAKGALAFFKEKYPDKVSVYSVAGFSKEICAGPHAERTSQLGNFKIIKEESSSAGVRRIKAVLQ